MSEDASKLRVGGIVLFGGLSRRMGRPKESLILDGRSLLHRVVSTVAQVAHPVLAVGRKGRHFPALPAGTLVAYDAVDDFGPLAGLSAGMNALKDRCDAAFVAACDQPLLKPEWISELVRLLKNHPAVVVRHRGRLHPLTALYRLETLPILDQMLAERRPRAEEFALRAQARIIEAAQLAHVDPQCDSLRNINDPADYQAIQRVRRSEQSGSIPGT